MYDVQCLTGSRGRFRFLLSQVRQLLRAQCSATVYHVETSVSPQQDDKLSIEPVRKCPVLYDGSHARRKNRFVSLF